MEKKNLLKTLNLFKKIHIEKIDEFKKESNEEEVVIFDGGLEFLNRFIRMIEDREFDLDKPKRKWFFIKTDIISQEKIDNYLKWYKEKALFEVGKNDCKESQMVTRKLLGELAVISIVEKTLDREVSWENVKK